MLDGQLLAFMGVALVISVTPGPDMALVLRNSIRDRGHCLVRQADVHLLLTDVDRRIQGQALRGALQGATSTR